MTGVRWTRAEAEQAAADALRRSNAPIATNALTDARAVLDALGITDTVTVVDALEDPKVTASTMRCAARWAEPSTKPRPHSPQAGRGGPTTGGGATGRGAAGSGRGGTSGGHRRPNQHKRGITRPPSSVAGVHGSGRPSPARRGTMWTWRCMTVCVAAAPTLVMRLHGQCVACRDGWESA